MACNDAGTQRVHLRLLHQRHQRVLGALARVQERREVAARAQLGSLQVQRPIRVSMLRRR
jgi:hypothetical protein